MTDFIDASDSDPELIIFSRKSDAEPTPDGAGWILRHTSRARRLWTCCAAFMAFLLLEVAITSLRGGIQEIAHLLGAKVILAALFLLFLCLALASRRRVILYDWGLEFHYPFRHSDRLVWQEIEDAYCPRTWWKGTAQILCLRRRDGRIFQIDVYAMEGMGRLRACLEKHIPEIVAKSHSLHMFEALAPRLKQAETSTSESRPHVEPGSGFVLVTHPLIRRAAEQALRKGNEAAKYIVKKGNEIYFSFDALGDAGERQRAVDLMTRIQADQSADMTELMWFVRRVFKE